MLIDETALLLLEALGPQLHSRDLIIRREEFFSLALKLSYSDPG
jgi:hypothetical protein